MGPVFGTLSEGGTTPRILVFSTNNISDPGIDLAGSSHMSYPAGVKVISLPCTSGIRPSWIVHALERGFDGVFIASDGDECALLSDCGKRSSRIVAEAQRQVKERGHDPNRLRLAAICSVCAEPFTKHMTQFAAALAELRPAPAELRQAPAELRPAPAELRQAPAEVTR